MAFRAGKKLPMNQNFEWSGKCTGPRRYNPRKSREVEEEEPVHREGQPEEVLLGEECIGW